MGSRILWTVWTVVPFMLAAESRASVPAYVPLATMINRAESIAIVRIDKMVPIERPKPHESIWWPNQTVSLEVEETLRGSLAETVTARVEVSRFRNPSAKPEESALLFVGQMIPFEKSPAKSETKVNAFGGAQGFMVLADLGRLKSGQDRRDALAAIRKSIENYQPELVVKSHEWSTVLNDAAVKPYFDLLKSKNLALQYWAIWKGVENVQVTPYIATELIGLLSDGDRTLARVAARHLMQQRYLPASEFLRKFADKDDELGRQILCYLQSRKIEDALENLGQETQARILPYVPDRSTSYVMSIPLDFLASEAGEVKQNRTRRERIAAVVEADVAKLDWTTMEILPFRFTVYVWRDDERPHFRIQERRD